MWWELCLFAFTVIKPHWESWCTSDSDTFSGVFFGDGNRMRHISHIMKNDISNISRILAYKIKTTHCLGLDYSGKMCRFNLAHRFSRCGTTSVSMSRVKYFFLDCLTLRDELDTLSRNFGSQLSTYPTQNPRSVKTSFTPRGKTGTVRCGVIIWTWSSTHVMVF